MFKINSIIIPQWIMIYILFMTYLVFDMFFQQIHHDRCNYNHGCFLQLYMFPHSGKVFGCKGLNKINWKNFLCNFFHSYYLVSVFLGNLKWLRFCETTPNKENTKINSKIRIQKLQLILFQYFLCWEAKTLCAIGLVSSIWECLILFHLLKYL